MWKNLHYALFFISKIVTLLSYVGCVHVATSELTSDKVIHGLGEFHQGINVHNVLPVNVFMKSLVSLKNCPYSNGKHTVLVRKLHPTIAKERLGFSAV